MLENIFEENSNLEDIGIYLDNKFNSNPTVKQNFFIDNTRSIKLDEDVMNLESKLKFLM